jgi:tetratricopeptide (TPR) repeat protein
VKALAVIVALAGSASANVWQSASDRGNEGKQEMYDAAMKAGDEQALQGKNRGASIPTVRKAVESADKMYRAAAAAKPDAPEPWFRIGKLLYTYFFDCEIFPAQFDIWRSPLCGSGSAFDRKRAAETVDAWNEFEKRAPLDPRATVVLGSSHLLFERAILNTKLVDTSNAKTSKERLEAAARDYEEILKRADMADDSGEPVLSNLAETYMMLDRLDEAIDTYREALRHGATTETQFGLAVALDRDDRGDEARELILKLGAQSYEEFRMRVLRQQTFFVPEGEQYYYFGLIDEVYGRYDTSIEYWKLYIRSGAHPEFQPRAKAHLDTLMTKRPKHPPPQLDLDYELFQP